MVYASVRADGQGADGSIQEAWAREKIERCVATCTKELVGTSVWVRVRIRAGPRLRRGSGSPRVRLGFALGQGPALGSDSD